MSVMVFASAIGPILFALGRNVTGSFTAIIIACALMPVVIALMGIWAHHPQEVRG
jgi:cyanate permease